MANKIDIKKKSSLTDKKTDKTYIANNNTFAFGKENYLFISIGVCVLAVGYMLMIGGGAETPDTFNPEIFSTRRVTVAPITLLIGFGIVLYGIMRKPKSQA
ncbi:MAG: DUF3098 domain-containing protein [Bacteroidetes bacterium]|nr:DUF3098 domain-containing protein [Bacteroidota bacterium]PHX82282.1 MAG: hypothetical protein CK539_05465 [Flavobacteriales bacterium]